MSERGISIKEVEQVLEFPDYTIKKNNKIESYKKVQAREIKGKILHKLTRLGKFKHSHTSIDNLPKGFPSEIRGRVKNMAKELKKEKILFSKPTHYGEEVSIDPTNKDKILYYINKFLEKKNI